MTRSLLGRLAAAGIVERAGPGRTVLRVSPRFLAYANGTAGRRRLFRPDDDPDSALLHALQTWDSLAGDATQATGLVRSILRERDQWGALAVGNAGWAA